MSRSVGIARLGMTVLFLCVIAASCTKSSTTATATTPGSTSSPTAGSPSAGSHSPTSTPSATSSPTSGPPANCTASQVSVIPGKFNAATTTDSGTFIFTNTSGGPCWMNGYAGMSMLSESGKTLKSRIVHGSNAVVPAVAVTRFLLKPSGSASFYYGYPTVPTGKQECPSSASVQITPPGGGAAVKVTFGMAPCGGIITESPLKPGAIIT